MNTGAIFEYAKNAKTDFLIFTGGFCPYCDAAKRLFKLKNLTFTDIDIDQEHDLRAKIIAETGHRTVPVIIDLQTDEPTFIGGYNETLSYLN